MVLDGVVNVCAPSRPGGLSPPANEQNGNAWTWGSNGGPQDLLDAMSICRVMYYFGHGTPYSFGVGANNHLTYGDIVFTLHNFPTDNGLPNLIATNANPYKLVWIDGCQSAAGPMCEAFGIPTGQMSTNNFISGGIRSRAYVGATKTVSFNPIQWDFRQAMMGSFWNGWFGNRSVHEMVTNCQQAFPAAPMDPSVVIDGATNMFIGNY
jgi:hypothetical protein